VQFPRRLFALPIVVLLLAVPVLSGCGEASDESAAVGVAKSGLLGGIGERLKREDDQAEEAELRQQAEETTPAERAEAREEAESEAAGGEGPESAGSPTELVGESS
jgi:hypothetical protein